MILFNNMVFKACYESYDSNAYNFSIPDDGKYLLKLIFIII